MAITTVRITTQQGRVLVTENGGRLLVRWSLRDPLLFAELLCAFACSFRGHQDRCWRQREYCWSLPLRHRDKLRTFLDRWFTPEAIDWRACPSARGATECLGKEE
jgi:hypothetical protein